MDCSYKMSVRQLGWIFDTLSQILIKTLLNNVDNIFFKW